MTISGSPPLLPALVAIGSVGTFLLPFTGAVARVIAFRGTAAPVEAVVGLSIPELAYYGWLPTMLALMAGVTYYAVGRLIQSTERTFDRVDEQLAEAEKRGLSAEGLNELTRQIADTKEENALLVAQRHRLVNQIASGEITGDEAQSAAIDLDRRERELLTRLEGLQVRVDSLKQLGDAMKEDVRDTLKSLERIPMYALSARLFRRIPERVSGVLRIVIDLLFIVLVLLTLPLAWAIAYYASARAAIALTGRARRAEPITPVRVVPVAVVALLFWAVVIGVTTPVRTVEATFHNPSALSDGVFAYVGTTSHSRYLIDCSDVSRVVGVPVEAVSVRFLPRPDNSPPDLLSWLADPSLPLLPAIGFRCPSANQ